MKSGKWKVDKREQALPLLQSPAPYSHTPLLYECVLWQQQQKVLWRQVKSCRKAKNVNLPNAGERKLAHLVQVQIAKPLVKAKLQSQSECECECCHSSSSLCSECSARFGSGLPGMAVSKLPQQPPPAVQSNFRDITDTDILLHTHRHTNNTHRHKLSHSYKSQGKQLPPPGATPKPKPL